MKVFSNMKLKKKMQKHICTVCNVSAMINGVKFFDFTTGISSSGGAFVVLKWWATATSSRTTTVYNNEDLSDSLL